MSSLHNFSRWVLLLACVFAIGWGVPVAADGTNLIAFVDGAGDLYTIQPDGKGKRRFASGELLQSVAFSPTQGAKSGRDVYSWPLWSWDGRSLACFRALAGEEGPMDGLYIFDVASSQVLNAYKAPFLQPVYAYWAPNNQQLAVLLKNGPGTFSLALWPTPGAQRPKMVAQGGPFYFHWRADAHALLIHTGSDTESNQGHSISLLEVENGKKQLVSRSPAAFNSPSWSHDGKWIAYGDAEKEGKQTALMIASADAGQPHAIGTFPQRIALAWSPTQSLLAVAASGSEEDPQAEELSLVDVASGKTRSLVKDHFAAYFWSPDGKKILYARQKPDSEIWTWVVVEVEDGKSYEVSDFIPARPLLVVFEFFDQYALSHRLWSPDSSSFVFTGSAGAEADMATAMQNPSVFVVKATAKATPESISDGHVAFWSAQ